MQQGEYEINLLKSTPRILPVASENIGVDFDILYCGLGKFGLSRCAHNAKNTGSNPVPATTSLFEKSKGLFYFRM